MLAFRLLFPNFGNTGLQRNIVHTAMKVYEVAVYEVGWTCEVLQFHFSECLLSGYFSKFWLVSPTPLLGPC